MPDEWGVFTGFNTMFTLVAGFIALVIVLMVVMFVVGAVRTARQGAADSAAPEVTAQARIVDKRVRLSGGGSRSSVTMTTETTFAGSGMSSSVPVSEEHYVTFEQAGGERFELKVPASDYGLLVVGDQGTVTMKGTRYLGFQRELMR